VGKSGEKKCILSDDNLGSVATGNSEESKKKGEEVKEKRREVEVWKGRGTSDRAWGEYFK